MKRRHYLLGGLALTLLIIQLIPSGLPPVENESAGDIIVSGLVGQEVVPVLKTSCYNCHSNATSYPWYAHVAPASWLIAYDVKKGREELNFSNWQDYDYQRMVSKLDDIATEVGEGHMPKSIYTLMHPSAKLSEEQRTLIVAWTETAMDELIEEEESEEGGEEDDSEEVEESMSGDR
jgi:Haem-binding domain